MKAIELVLDKLKKAKNKGISVQDFSAGFRLGARIYDLRSKGFAINTDKQIDSGCGYKREIARYTLTRSK